MKDDLNTLFDSYRPTMGDADEYMERLQQKMKAMETVKRYADAQRRLYRRRMLVAFVTGIVVGSVALIYIILHPMVPTKEMSRMVLWTIQFRPVLTALMVALVSTAAAILLTRQPATESSFSRSTPW